MYCEPCQASMVTKAPVDTKHGLPVKVLYSVPPIWRQTHRLVATCTQCQRKEYVGTIVYTVDENGRLA